MATQIKVQGKTVYVTPTGFKVGSRGRVAAPATVYATLPKSERRKLRKAARSGGFKAHAAAPAVR